MPNLSGSNTGTQNMVENSNHSVTLSGDMGIRDAKKLISELKISISTDAKLQVYLGDVSSIDTSILQVLIAARVSAKECNCQIIFKDFNLSPVPAFIASLGLEIDEIGLG
jgi:ABC-type transporter Mla MlaB component